MIVPPVQEAEYILNARFPWVLLNVSVLLLTGAVDYLIAVNCDS
jgi:hypothetical protein